MADIGAGEAHALASFLADHDVNCALHEFARQQYRFYQAKCSENMIGEKQNIAKARQFAHFALVYETLLPELHNFAKEQLRKA